MKISIEELVERITIEVITELLKRGIDVEFSIDKNSSSETSVKTSIEIDMSNYKTPVLTENNLLSLKPGITDIIIPGGTVITPGARDIIREKKLNITYKNKSN